MQEASVVKTGPVGADLSIVVGKGEVEAEFEKYAKEIKEKVRIDGFRQGAAPLSIIRQKFAKEIKAEVSSRLVQRETEVALREKQVKSVGNPTLKEPFRSSKQKQWLGDFKLDGSFVYEISTDLEPDVEITDYKNLEVEVSLPNPETWIASRVTEIQNQFSEKEPVVRPAKLGDELTISFAGSVDGVVFQDEAKGWRTFVLGSNKLEGRFEAALVGKAAGETFDISLNFNASMPDPNLAGKTARFEGTIHSVVEIKVHEINDELAQKAVYDGLDHMMSEIRAKAVEEFEKPRKATIFDAIMTKILEKTPFVVPPSWIENEMRVVAYRFGLQEMPTDPDELNSLRELAQRSVQQSFILDQVYKKEEAIQITGAELETELNKEAAKVGKTAPELLAYLKNSGKYEGLVSFMEQQRAVDFLIANTNIKETV